MSLSLCFSIIVKRGGQLTPVFHNKPVYCFIWIDCTVAGAYIHSSCIHWRTWSSSLNNNCHRSLKAVVPTVVVFPVNVCRWPEDSLVTGFGIPGMPRSSLCTTPSTNSTWRAGITRPRLKGGREKELNEWERLKERNREREERGGESKEIYWRPDNRWKRVIFPLTAIELGMTSSRPRAGHWYRLHTGSSIFVGGHILGFCSHIFIK